MARRYDCNDATDRTTGLREAASAVRRRLEADIGRLDDWRPLLGLGLRELFQKPIITLAIKTFDRHRLVRFMAVGQRYEPESQRSFVP